MTNDKIKELLELAFDAGEYKASGSLDAHHINNLPTFDEWYKEQVKNCLIADVVKPLPTEFADWIADQDLYRYHDGWEIDGEKFDTDELYAEFLKCYPTWSANG